MPSNGYELEGEKSLQKSLVNLDEVQSLFAYAEGRWTGCDWPMAMGPRQLDLQGVRANQARLLAELTPGDEATAWDEAARYLYTIERDARDAENAARRAVELFRLDSLPQSASEIERAVSLEARYRKPLVWESLRAAIVAQ